MSIYPSIAVIIGALLTFVCLIMAFRCLKRKRLIDDLPTSKTQGAFIGLTELKGTAESESPLTSYLAEMKCVQYTWDVKEHWSRTVTETYTDSNGHMQIRTRHESGWTVVAQGGEAAPFYLKDDSGVIRIVPEGAEIKSIHTMSKTIRRDNAFYFGKGPRQEITNTDHERLFEETAIPLHVGLYVMGQSRERNDVIAAEIAPVFLISMQTESQVSTGYGRWCFFWASLGFVLMMGGVFVQSRLEPFGRETGLLPYIIAAFVYFLALLAGWTWTVHNSMVSLRQRVKQAWSQVEIQLKRRHDLLMNFIPVVDGYRAHEKETQTFIAALRTQLSAPGGQPGNTELKSLSPEFRVIIEKYPDLKAGESFMALQRALSDTENRIALARIYYNDIATFYNSRLVVIPDRLVAGLTRLAPQPLMSAASFERAPVNITLAV
jgi:hypothetical protein